MRAMVECTIRELARCDNASFHALVVPLGEMCKLTYTATHGSYFEPTAANASVPGWTRDLRLTANPAAGGMRALVFLHPRLPRGVVAFRGTDLDPATVSGQADACADRILFDPSRKLQPYCSGFSEHTLNYWSRALDFVRAVRSAHPVRSFTFTGHSLGAALALMMAATGAAGPPGPPQIPP